ncbi:MAG: aspartate kinase [Bacilli bacterium]|nr:aspartate kinase [Bacilli bacterium]
MKTAVLKFGGSSVSDDTNLNIVANKIIDYKKLFKNLVVVVSAQGKTTNKLTEEAKGLSKLPNEREMDMLLSAGEIMSAAKLSILLNKKECPTVSLTGWQAGIITNDIHQNAQISEINTKRIKEELNKNKIVIVTGFQGIDENLDVTTLGRGGSDTSAVSLAAALKADKCYIFSDVDGVYTADPNEIKEAKKLNTISFEEMQEIADAGAKVLHNRCIKIGKKFKCNIIAASTFDEKEGTTITKEIEDNSIKGIIKNNDIIKYIIDEKETYKIYEELLKNNIITEKFNSEKNIEFYIQRKDKEKLEELLNELNINYNSKNIIKLSIIGYGVNEDSDTLSIVINILKNNDIDIKNISLTQSKIEIITDKLEDEVVKKLHSVLIEKTF